MKILVTGANGYLGSGIVKAILDLLHDEKAEKTLTERGLNRVKANYSLDAVCKKLYAAWLSA